MLAVQTRECGLAMMSDIRDVSTLDSRIDLLDKEGTPLLVVD